MGEGDQGKESLKDETAGHNQGSWVSWEAEAFPVRHKPLGYCRSGRTRSYQKCGLVRARFRAHPPSLPFSVPSLLMVRTSS